MIKLINIKLFILALFMTNLFFLGCSEDPPVSPILNAKKLIALHGLTGRKPSDRPQELKDNPVSQEELDELILYKDKQSKFVKDIYTGMIVGAIARNQMKLIENITGDTAVVEAGNIDIFYTKKDNKWKIDLEKTIPDALKEIAVKEKERYDAARVRAIEAQK